MYKVTQLIPPSGGESYAFGINAQGDVAGTAADERGVWSAFLFLRREDRMVMLDSPGGGPSVAYDLNDRAPDRLPQVIGYSTTDAGSQHAFQWSQAASGGGAWTATDLGTLGGKNSWAISINNQGQIVGGAESGHMVGTQFGVVPFIWAAGQMTPIEVPAQQPPPNQLSEQWALDIDDTQPFPYVLLGCNGYTRGFALCSTNQNPITVSAWDDRLIWPTSFSNTNTELQICGRVGNRGGTQPGSLNILSLDSAGNGQARPFMDTTGLTPWIYAWPNPQPPYVGVANPFTNLPGWSGMGGALNRSGQVAATFSWLEDFNSTRHFAGIVFDGHNGVDFLQDLTIEATQVDVATDINDDGLIVGYQGGTESTIEAGQQYPDPARALLLVPFKNPTSPLRAPSVYGLLVSVVASITQDGGGTPRYPGHQPAPPVPPFGPLSSLPPAERNILLGLAMKELAGLVTDSTARLEIQRAVATLVTTSAAEFARATVGEMPAVRTSQPPPAFHAKFSRLRTITQAKLGIRKRLMRGKK